MPRPTSNRAVAARKPISDSEARLSLLASIVDSSDDAIMSKTLDGVITSWNRAAEEIYGYKAGEIIGKPVSLLVPPDRPDEMTTLLKKIKSGKRVDHYETIRVRKGGKAISVSLAVSPIHDANNKVIGASTIARDISERRRAEEKIRTAAQYGRSLIEASLDPLVTIGLDGKITDVNRATEEITGASRKDLIGTDFSEYFTEPDQARSGYQRVFKEGMVRDYPLGLRHRDGHVTPVLYNASTYQDESGEVIGVFAAARDVGEIRKVQEEQRKTAAYGRSLIEASLDPLVTIGLDGRITDVNQATEEITGASRKELIGTDFSDYFTEPDQARSGYQRVFKEGMVRDYPLELRHRDGQVTPVLYNARTYQDESGEVVGVFAAARDISDLKKAEEEREARDWLKTGLSRLNDVMRGSLDVPGLSSSALAEIARYLDCKVGAIYIMDEKDGEPSLSLLGSYAYTKRKNLSNLFKVGEGIIGQAALEKQQILIRNVPEDYIKVTSGLGEATPRFICVTPLLYEERVKGVLELGTLGELTDLQLEYLKQAMPALAITFEAAQSRQELARTLERSQQLTEELQAQQEELKTANEELEEQTQRLKESEEKLQAQQEELQVANEELEEKNELLERQKSEVERARKDIGEQAEQLALASKYKSEFLANMSHELRTPLNSLLLLAQELAENKNGNLTDDQVESARVIHGSGNDLLKLINEILDLSKIEAGRMDLQLGPVKVADLADGVRASFEHMTDEKGLSLEVVAGEDTPAEIVSDRKRIEQIIRNLMSNAIKFTESGGVTVTFGRPVAGTNLSRSGLYARECLAVAVKDTGIGIAPEQQKIIFEAFQQIDGGTTRRYGGTGLGLSISREFSRLLGGEIQLASEPGNGSTFTLYLPVALTADRKLLSGGAATVTVSRTDTGPPRDAEQSMADAVQIEDDRESLGKDDRVILVIEDDPDFARLLHRICHEKGFKCLAAPTGEAGLELARKHLPHAVILDIRLPGIDGWAVLSALKENILTRHIPVHIVSVEEASSEALRWGAVGHATKPLAREDLEGIFLRLEQVSAGTPRRLLVVEDNADIRRKTVKLIGNGDIKVDEVESGGQALEAIRSTRYDCVILDLGLPDIDGLELLETLEREGVEVPPVIIHTARDLTRDEEMGLREHAESIIVKDVRSQERLLDEVSLFLHRIVSQMPAKKRQIICDLHDSDVLLRDKKVLIVDDDMRTTFALSRLLSERGMKTLKADNGDKALRLLEQEPDVDLVLMDIMMPVMDGYEAMTRIRAQDRFRRLPIIALTAKAMKEDREKCIAAGANDYLPKPVDQDRLISMMRVWLYR